MGKKNKGRKKRRRQGRTPHYRGKPLRQLLANLPNHGVGRLIVRGSFKQNEEEPTYMRILEVDFARKIKHKRNGKIKIPVKVERIWRGVIFPRPVSIQTTSYLPDFNLVPKDQEEKFIRNTKTPREKGYVYWTAEQRRNIRNLVDQGMSIAEAKAKEKERIFREEDEAAKHGGVAPQQRTFDDISSAIVYDNYDDADFDDENGRETDESFDSDCDLDEKVIKEQKSNHCVPEEKGIKNQKSKPIDLEPDDINYDNFTEEQNQRVENMVKRGMIVETAKQMEWERQIAFERAAENESGGAKGMQEISKSGESVKLA